MGPGATAAFNIGSNLQQSFQQRKDENAIESILSQAMQSEDPRMVQDSIGKILSSVSPQNQDKAVKVLQQTYQNLQAQRQTQQQQQSKGQQQKDLFAHQTSLQQLKNQGLMDAAKERNLGKTQQAPKLSPFENKLQGLNAESYFKTTQEEIPKLNSILKTIDMMEKDLNKVGGVSGYIKSALGSEDAAKFDAQGLTLIEPIVKIFNPVGAIPTAKIELVKDKFAPRASSTNRSNKGKLEAVKAFSKQALDRANQRVKLIEQYNGNPPPNVLGQFDNESESLVDAMLEYPVEGEDKGSEDDMVSVTNPEGQTGKIPRKNLSKLGEGWKVNG